MRTSEYYKIESLEIKISYLASCFFGNAANNALNTFDPDF